MSVSMDVTFGAIGGLSVLGQTQKVLSSRRRHRRSDFCYGSTCSPGEELDLQILDFTPAGEAEEASDLLSLLSRRLLDPAHEPNEVVCVLDKLAEAVRTRRDVTTPDLIDLDYASWYEEPARNQMRMQVRILAGGQRIEAYTNGSTVIKDVLGRVTEVRSRFGDMLVFQYGAFGKLESFQRIDRQGLSHSSGKRDKHGVTVRDQEGRVRAAGESMTVDPWGCFYLHSFDGQYFCLDLVAGIHCERRRIARMDGGTDYVTAAFAHDGFRMATMYSRSQEGCPQTKRTPVFRFYGRDGTLIEFESEEDLRRHMPSRAALPGSKPPDASWLKRPQANTAWESVFEYLGRVS